jgi:hypothetical protein
LIKDAEEKAMAFASDENNSGVAIIKLDDNREFKR